MTENASGPEEGQVPCVACKELIVRGATLCKTCKSAQFGYPCRTCRALIIAKRCNTCQSYQDWRRHLPAQPVLSLLVAILALIAPAIGAFSNLIDRSSHTHFRVVTSDENVILITVWNTGNAPSVILGARLHFDSLPIDDVVLHIPEVDQKAWKIVVSKDPRLNTALTVLPPNLGLYAGKNRYTKEEIAALPGSQRVTVFLRVAESSGKDVELSDTQTVNSIKPFIMNRIYANDEK